MPGLEESIRILEGRGFQILVYQHACFDIAARRKAFSILVKVIGNIDGFRPEVAEELKNLASCVSAFPIIVGETSKTGKLAGAVYSRFGIPAMNAGTLAECIDGATVPQSSQGRELVSPDSLRMRAARESLGLSREDLASRVGITQQSVYLAERGEMGLRKETLSKLESVLKEPLEKHASPFVEPVAKPARTETALGKKLSSFDFDVFSFSRTGFDVLAKDEKNRVVVRESVPRDISGISGFSEFFSALLALVSERPEKRAPVVLREELEGVDTKKQFLRLLREKQV